MYSQKCGIVCVPSSVMVGFDVEGRRLQPRTDTMRFLASTGLIIDYPRIMQTYTVPYDIDPSDAMGS